MSFDAKEQQINMVEICLYDYSADNWKWTNKIGADKEISGNEEDAETFQSFSKKLKDLADG